MNTSNTKNKKNNNSYNIIIIILMVLIVVVAILLFTNSNEKVVPTKNEEANKPTPPTPQPETSILTLNLKGEKQMTVIKGQPFEDPGYTAHDSSEGDLTDKVVVEGTVDSNTVGTYTITYRVSNSNKAKTERTRTVTVIEDLDITIDYSPKDLTNNDVTITIKITGNCLDSIIDPKGNSIKAKEAQYKVNANSEYKFTIKRTDGSTIEKTIKVDNIDKKKPTGTCKSTITTNKTSIVVTAKDDSGIQKYTYNYNNKTKDSTTNTYTVNEVASNVTVTIYDKAGNSEKITCNKIDDTWPVIKNQNFQNHSAKNYQQNGRYEARMNYLIYYPDNMSLSEKHPLIVYLHGLGEFGTNINNTLAGSSAFANNMKYGRFQQKAIFLAPQCYAGSKRWTDCFNDLKGLIDKVVKEYNVDTNKITMTGHSLGGQAVFDFIVKYPGFLAAAAPLSPSYPWNHDYSKMKNMKIAVFIGTEEGLYTRDQPEIEYLQKNGVNLKFYPLQGITHSSQKAFFNGTNIIDWLITQSK